MLHCFHHRWFTAILIAPIPFLLQVGAVAPLTAAEPASNTLTPEEQQAGWKLLFDGKTTAGWRNFKTKTISDGWKVIDGALTRTAKAGDIISAEQFGNFELSLEYKIAPHGNSGLMFHVTEAEKIPWYTGPEVQILDNADKETQKAGYLYDLYPAKVDAAKPAGQWNRMRLVVTPKKCEVFMNEVKYFEFVIGSPDWNQRVAKSKFNSHPQFGKSAKGHFCLQDHGSEVAFRNIKIRPLPEK